MSGYYTTQCVVYRALVTSGDPTTPMAQEVQTYTGLTENHIKKRIKKHYYDIKHFNPNDPENQGTRLSRHCGQLRLDGKPFNIEWSILCETGHAFSPTTGICKLCLTEKYLIMFNSADASLNLRSEFFNHCRHKERHLLAKSWKLKEWRLIPQSISFNMCCIYFWYWCYCLYACYVIFGVIWPYVLLKSVLMIRNKFVQELMRFSSTSLIV